MAKGGNRILTDFPKRGNRIDWKSTVGMEVELIYNDKLYVVKIVGYEYPVLKIEYNKTIKTIKCDNFIRASVGGILNLITKDFKIEVGEQVRDMIITDRKYIKTERTDYTENRKFYKYKCNKCGWDNGWIMEGDLLKGRGCACCANKTVVENINSIWVTDRWMCDLGLSEEDAKTHTSGSKDKVVVICPDCGKEKEITIGKLFQRKSIGCSCGDGVKYPEKFMTSVLDQLNIEYIFQLTKTTFDWCGNKKYDFYIPSLNTIIETHGRQHYEETKIGNRNLAEEQENDKYKYELAMKNGIKDDNYIVIDCRLSTMDWIKKSILDSKLNELFDLSKIDWLKCEEFAINSNKVKEVCDYWNNKEEWETTKDLMKVFKLSRDVIIDYLKRGTKLGWCNYSGKEERINNYKKSSKPVAIFKDGEPYIPEYRKDNVFESATEIDRLSRENIDIFGKILKHQCISAVCNGKRKTYNGYTFKFVEE